MTHPIRALVVLVCACGAPSAPPGPPPAAAPVVIATPPRSADDVAVASVNGRTVWGSCVAGQARALVAAGAPPGGDADRVRRSALDQCIAFELLAQAAEARGTAAAPEVGAALRTAAVNRLVSLEFDQRYQTPDDMKSTVDAVMKRNEWRMHVPELRTSTFARFVVDKEAPAEVDARAHQLADQLAAELAGQTGLYGIHLTEAAARIAEGSGIELDTADVKPSRPVDLVKPYADALFAIPEVGRASFPAVRTQWGWDVMVWTGGMVAEQRSRDEVVAELFPELRRRQFQVWVTQLGKQLGLQIEVDQGVLERFETQAETGAPP